MDKSKFKNSNGERYTKSLFFETCVGDKSSVLYTLKDEDHLGYVSLYKLFMAEEDLTEYEFANKHLDSWDHWCKLKECSWFQPYLERWREELFLKIQARSLKNIKTLAKGQTRDAFAASKYLLEKGWEPKEKNTKGRPTKDAIKMEASRMAEEEKIHSEAAKRIQLN